jgi:hypothetical protein
MLAAVLTAGVTIGVEAVAQPSFPAFAAAASSNARRRRNARRVMLSCVGDHFTLFMNILALFTISGPPDPPDPAFPPSKSLAGKFFFSSLTNDLSICS